MQLTREWLPRLFPQERDFQRIPRLPGNQYGVCLRRKPHQSPAKARMGGGVVVRGFQMTGV